MVDIAKKYAPKTNHRLDSWRCAVTIFPFLPPLAV